MIPPEETTETDLLEGTTSMVLPPEENTEIDLPEGSWIWDHEDKSFWIGMEMSRVESNSSELDSAR